MNRYEQLKADLKKENAGKHYLKQVYPTDCLEILCAEIDKLRGDLAAAQGDAFITKALLCSPVTGDRLAIVDVSTAKKSYRITVGNASEKWIHTIGTEEAPATNAQLAACLRPQKIKFLYWDTDNELQLWRYSPERTGCDDRVPALVIQAEDRAHANRLMDLIYQNTKANRQ